MTFRPIGLWQHVVNHVVPTGLHNRQCFIQCFILTGNRIRENQGGYAVAKNGKILGEVALPIAGLMSDRSFEKVANELQRLREATRQMGSAMEDPTMILAFLSLCVVPVLKLTDFGLVRFAPPQDESPVLIHDQRSLHGHPA